MSSSSSFAVATGATAAREATWSSTIARRKSGFRSIWLPALFAAGLAHEETNATGRTIIVADFRFHWLRHTAISLMARAGMKPELIAERVGHRDGGALIYRRYRHLFPSEVRTAVGLLDALVSSENAARASAGSGH